jgi:hypothetical protein
LYIALYGHRGALVGWIDFTNGNFVGDTSWFRIGAYGPRYKSGFTNTLSISSSLFVPGTATSPVLALTNLMVTLSGGGLANAISNDVTLYNNGKLAANGPEISNLTLSVSPATGVATGNFVDPATGRVTVIKGVILQQQTNGGGFFIATNAVGKFLLTPQP